MMPHTKFTIESLTAARKKYQYRLQVVIVLSFFRPDVHAEAVFGLNIPALCHKSKKYSVKLGCFVRERNSTFTRISVNVFRCITGLQDQSLKTTSH